MWMCKTKKNPFQPVSPSPVPTKWTQPGKFSSKIEKFPHRKITPLEKLPYWKTPFPPFIILNKAGCFNTFVIFPSLFSNGSLTLFGSRDTPFCCSWVDISMFILKCDENLIWWKEQDVYIQNCKIDRKF